MHANIKFAACLIGIGVLLGATSCRKRAAPPPAQVEGKPQILLYCGAGIRSAAEPLIRSFEQARGIKVATAYAGSGQLLGQLVTSKQGDVFMPAEGFYTDQAIEAGLGLAASRRTVAYFIPVIFVQKGNPLGITGLKDLADRKLRVGMGDERVVAAGRVAAELFRKNGIDAARVAANVIMKSGTVSELGVAIENKAIDAAIVWDVTARQFRRAGTAVAIPAEQNIPTPITVVRLTCSRNPGAADAFVDFLASEDARRIFAYQEYTVALPETTNSAAAP